MLKRSRIALIALLASILSLGYIPARIAIAKHQSPAPEMILVLGGSSDRERLATQLAQAKPDLQVWVSSGTSEAVEIFQAAHIPSSRVHYDWRASDTVTNFTTVVDDLKRRGVQHVYIITSDFHLARSQTIATLVFGTQGIAVTPLTVPSQRSPESAFHILRDAGRSLVWLVTGRTGASFRRFR